MKCPSLQTFVLALLVLFVSNHALGQESSDELVDFIKSKWQDRYGKFKSVAFTLDVKETVEKGFFSLPRPGDPPARAILPEKDVVNRLTTKYVIDEDKIFVEHSGPVYHLDHGWWDEIQERKAFDGKETRRFTEFKKAETKLQGSIHSGKHLPSCEVVDLYPVDAWLGPLWFGQFKLENLKATEDPSTRDEPNAVIEARDARGITIWFDPACDFMFVGLTLMGGDRGSNLEVAYDLHETYGWYPQRWKFTSTFSGVERTKEYELRDLKINPDVDPSVFEVSFAPGTIVYDHAQEKPVRVVVQPDGSLSPLPPPKSRKPGALN